MERPSSSIPVRTGIPRPTTSRLPVLNKPAAAPQTQLRNATSVEQLRKKSSISSLSQPRTTSTLATSVQKKPSRTSLLPSSTSTTSAAARSNPAQATRTSISKQPTAANSQIRRPSGYNAPTPVFKKPVGRPASRQRAIPPPTAKPRDKPQEEDGLGDLDGFRSASRASSRAGFRDAEPESALIDEPEQANEIPLPAEKKGGRLSLADRTIESLSHVPASPVSKGRRRFSFFNPDNPMPPPARPGSALGNNGRPLTSDGTPHPTPATPRRFGAPSQIGSMTAPGKRSVSAATASSSIATPSKVTSVIRPPSQSKKQPFSQVLNLQTTIKPRPLSNSKTMIAKSPQSRSSLADVFGEAISPSDPASASTPPPSRGNTRTNGTPETSRKVSSSSPALREQIAKAKAARRTEAAPKSETPSKPSASSSMLREQIAKAKEAARRAHAAKQFGNGTPPRAVPAVTENEFGIQPDPAEIAGFDFGLDDPFNQRPKGSKSLLRKRIDAARLDGRLNISAMELTEFPDEVFNMYEYNPDDKTVAWGEIVDMTAIMAADNNLESLPEALFPDIEVESLQDSDDVLPQFGGVQSLDLHGNVLRQLPVGLRHLTQLSKLNLSRNQLPVQAFDVITQITCLRELKLADNAIEGAVPSTLGLLSQLEVLELQGNKINMLPPEIRELVHLRSLNVSGNRLQALPSELFTSVPLIELIAGKNAFGGSFFDVDAAPQLQILHLGNNSLSSLSASGVVSLPALKYLDISANRLSTMPDMEAWKSLTTLLAGENKLTTFPEGFTSLQQLRSADFSSNDITKLDEKIALMDGLEILTLAANPIRERKFMSMSAEDIKKDLRSRLVDVATEEEEMEPTGPTPGKESEWELKSSGILDLSFKNLLEVDDATMVEFAATNDVRQLLLPQNYLTTIPMALSHLTSLTLLDLSKNSIMHPLTELLELPKLKELRLPGNKLQSLDSITTFLSAPNLQHLDVSNNRITGSLPNLREKFPDLSRLMAADNALSEVQAESLKGFKIVNLSNNEIARLDPYIGLLQGTLTGFEVEGNTFRVPNHAMIRKGTEAILSWLKDKVPESADGLFLAPEPDGEDY